MFKFSVPLCICYHVRNCIILVSLLMQVVFVKVFLSSDYCSVALFVYDVQVSCEFIVLASILMYCLVFSGVYVLSVTVIISQQIHFGYKNLLAQRIMIWFVDSFCYIFTWLQLGIQLLVNLFEAHFLSTHFPSQEYLHQQSLLRNTFLFDSAHPAIL